MTISASSANAGKPYTQAEFEARRADNAKLVDYLRNSGLEIPANKVARLIATAAQAFGGTTQPATRRASSEQTAEYKAMLAANRYPVNFGEEREGVEAVLLPLGDAEAVERLTRDIEAFGYGMGESGQTAEGLEWNERSKAARAKVREHFVHIVSRATPTLNESKSADTERLDWLSGEGDTWIVPSVNGFVVRRGADHDDDSAEFPTLREAIDAARGISTTPESPTLRAPEVTDESERIVNLGTLLNRAAQMLEGAAEYGEDEEWNAEARKLAAFLKGSSTPEIASEKPRQDLSKWCAATTETCGAPVSVGRDYCDEHDPDTGWGHRQSPPTGRQDMSESERKND